MKTAVMRDFTPKTNRPYRRSPDVIEASFTLLIGTSVCLDIRVYDRRSSRRRADA
jgi:hypothetical protein